MSQGELTNADGREKRMTSITDESARAATGARNNGGMEMLDYVQNRSDQTMAVLRQAYDDLHERAYKLATVLVAGGGGAGAYALGKLAAEARAITWAPLAALALVWFGAAGVLVWRATTSRDLSPGNGPKNLLGYYAERLVALGDGDAALEHTRLAEMDLQQARIRAYEAGCIERAAALDGAYKAVAVCSPAVLMVVAATCWYYS